jgi:SHS2 domain-containing protein
VSAGARRGHRFVPHTADIRIEAWAPTREACLAEAVAALIASFAEVTGVAPASEVSTEINADRDVDLLVSVLDDVIFLLDTRGVVPARAEVSAGPSGVTCRFWLAPLDSVEVTGAVPKAVTLHEISFGPRDHHWACAFTVDV